ncbi:MAG: AMP-binding protein [Ilumatobacteraceae bacterium]
MGNGAIESNPVTNLARVLDGHPDDDVALISPDLTSPDLTSPDRIGTDRTTTYGELREQVGRLRGGLVGLGIGEGDRVAIVCTNDRPFVVVYLATVGLGAVAVPLNPGSPAPELQRELVAVDPVAIVVEPHVVDTWARVDRSALTSMRHVIVTEAVTERAPAAADDRRALDDLLADDPVEVRDLPADTSAVMMFTSGTAGAPLPAMLSHRNLLANIAQSRSTPVHIDAGDVVYGVLPLFHIFGLNVVLGMSLSAGATVALVQRFDPATAADQIRSLGVTVLPGAPPLWVSFADADHLPADTFERVRIALSGASRLPVAIARRIEERFGLQIAEGYGLTEAAPVVTSSSGLTGGPRYGSVGRALEGVDVRLAGDGGDVLVGDVGEILVRGANVFQGYYDDPSTTARVLDADGWLHTGDMAVADDDGWLYLVDRAKDLIIVSGFNVYPAEVEEILSSHPAVAEAGVVGVPDPNTGETVTAFVALEPGADLDEGALIDFACDHLARYKCPSTVSFVRELPRNVSGKLVRRHLADTVLDV